MTATTVHSELHDWAQTGETMMEVEGLVTHFPITGGLLRREIGVVQAVAAGRHDRRGTAAGGRIGRGRGSG